MTVTETRKCMGCGGERETKRSLEYSLTCPNCQGWLIKKREYENHKGDSKVY